MTTLGRLLPLGAIFALTACGDSRRQDAEHTLHQVGTPTLRREAASLYKQLYAASGNQHFLPKFDHWPPGFRRFQPLRVRAYADGFALVLREGRAVEEGIYVVPAAMESSPRVSRNARFQQIDDGIYWYWFTE